MDPILLQGVEVRLAVLFRDFVDAFPGRVLGVAVADGRGAPIASRFSIDVNVGRVCHLAVLLMESVGLLADAATVPRPALGMFRGERYKMIVWRLPVVGGPFLCVYRRGSEAFENRLRELLREVEQTLTPRVPA